MIQSRVRRKKSINQIRAQQERLLSRAEGNRTRTERINRIASNYVRNIAQTKTFANAVDGGAGLSSARSRAYSQNTYMGYLNG